MTTTTIDLTSAPPGPGGPMARLRLADTAGSGQLDGGWWPRSQDVTVELPQLLACLGRLTRVSLCQSDWPLPHPTRTTQRGLPVKVGWFSTMESHTITLGSSSPSSRRLLLLVVPDGTGDDQAERDLAAASTPTELRATALLAELALPVPRGASARTKSAARPQRPTPTAPS